MKIRSRLAIEPIHDRNGKYTGRATGRWHPRSKAYPYSSDRQNKRKFMRDCMRIAAGWRAA